MHNYDFSSVLLLFTAPTLLRLFDSFPNLTFLLVFHGLRDYLVVGGPGEAGALGEVRLGQEMGFRARCSDM